MQFMLETTIVHNGKDYKKAIMMDTDNFSNDIIDLITAAIFVPLNKENAIMELNKIKSLLKATLIESQLIQEGKI